MLYFHVWLSHSKFTDILIDPNISISLIGVSATEAGSNKTGLSSGKYHIVQDFFIATSFRKTALVGNGAVLRNKATMLESRHNPYLGNKSINIFLDTSKDYCPPGCLSYVQYEHLRRFVPNSGVILVDLNAPSTFAERRCPLRCEA
jgi:hypothetical protein